MNDKNRINTVRCFFAYFLGLVFFNCLHAMMNSSQLNSSFSSNPINTTFSVNQNNSNNSNNSLNQNDWQMVSSKNNMEASKKQFNWQQRKVLKQKAYKIYTNLNIVIEDIADIISKFSLKIEAVKQVVIDFNNTVELKCRELNPDYHSLVDFSNYIRFWTEKINEFKKTVYYNLHKDFRKKIDAEWQNFENIKNMIDHYQSSILKMYKLENILIQGVSSLSSFQTTALAYEDRAWVKYQELDELINDKTAESNFLEINNCSENAILINTYLRGDFLDFFNQNMVNLNNATTQILAAIDDLITHINQTNVFIGNLELEIKVYDENVQKEKLALELEEKMAIESQLRLKKEKEKKALELEMQQRGFFKKAVSAVLPELYKIQQYFFDVYQVVSNKIFLYYNSFFNNSVKAINNIVKKEDNKITLSQEVSQAVSLIPPLVEEKTDIVLFTSPAAEANNPAIGLVENTNVSKNQFNSDSGGIPGETKIEDVFSVSPQQGYNQEKDKLGASSYPTRIISAGDQMNTAVLQEQTNKGPGQVDLVAPIVLQATEDIVIPDQKDSETQESTPENLFKYQPSEREAAEQRPEDKLLPDLSNLEQKRVPSGNSAGAVRSEVNQVFEATSGSHQRKSRVRNKAKDGDDGDTPKTNKKDDDGSESPKKSSGKNKNKKKKKNK